MNNFNVDEFQYYYLNDPDPYNDYIINNNDKILFG